LVLALFVTAAVSLFAEKKPRIIGGVVSDASGPVVANADLTLTAYDTNNQERSTLQTRTDETGHYSFSSVDADRLALTVRKYGKIPDRTTFTTKTDTVDVLVIDITM
jgi:hypothetical protein